MSRYSAINDKGEKFDYGYDHPLQEYFLQGTIKDEDTGEMEPIEIVGSLSDTYGSAGNLLEALKERNIQVPKEHLAAMIGDLPF